MVQPRAVTLSNYCSREVPTSEDLIFSLYLNDWGQLMKFHQGNREFPEKFPIINYYLKCPRDLALFGHNKGDSLRVSLLQVSVWKAVLGNTKGSITNQFPNVQSASSEPENNLAAWPDLHKYLTSPCKQKDSFMVCSSGRKCGHQKVKYLGQISRGPIGDLKISVNMGP